MEFDSNKSIFLQIADSISEKVVSGAYPPGQRIPSVRELAAEMGVNPNTIMRTYNELQSMDVISNKRGIGYFVNDEAQKKILNRKRAEFFARALPEFLRQAELLGITLSDLKSHLNKLNNVNKNENK